MNIANLTTINTAEAISARRESLGALEEALKKKILELREICLKEGELTGQLPVEYPLQPREPIPQIRHRSNMPPPPPKNISKRTTSSTSAKLSSETLDKIGASSSRQKHFSCHAIKYKDCPPPLSVGEYKKPTTLEDVHHKILQMQSAYDSGTVLSMSASGSRSNGNFEPSTPLEKDKIASRDVARNHSESCIDHNKLDKQKQGAHHTVNSESSRQPHNRFRASSDISSISIKTMIQPTNSTQASLLHNDEIKKSVPSSQNSEQSIKIANLHREILKLQAGQSNYGLTTENKPRKTYLTNSKTLGSLDAVDSAKDQTFNIHHQRVVSDGCRHQNEQSKSNRFGKNTMQSDNYVCQNSIARAESLNPNIETIEIPAGSKKDISHAVSSSESVGDENINPLTKKVSQLSIEGVGNFQPYWEETKPYEISDFYKYSAKHRANKKSSNMNERIRNLEEKILADKSKARQLNDDEILLKNIKPQEIVDNNNRNTAINNNKLMQQNIHSRTSSSFASSSSSNHNFNHSNNQPQTSSNCTLSSRYA